ncbi:cbb3-type cytochrome oxidase assembly protein CcoS [Mesobaculum littorinae]|uniref:Cbb3-type cytochrome oxidase assembly protein CcoS n=1 Tax=Mesobaculum littorinae TaxID=2486419 RepID=A0A438ADF1_9RHOB|nr:cbb3-type cytochrome oxidase assembly protein CcoS [Mesobaculum littorinae]RVV96726.1 cbb3-type cytochrome oxidase assembly protein CcoS [Mesobaculum littorinae]
MGILALLIPVTLVMGAAGVAVFFWALRNGQFEDPEGDAHRILQTDDRPLPAPDDTDRRYAR